jgi:nitrate/nitrite transport system substrate-binding protein
MKKTGMTLKKRMAALSAVAAVTTLMFASSAGAVADLEKENLKFGFIKLTDMAP